MPSPTRCDWPRWARSVAADTAYRGQWALGMAIDGLHGLASNALYDGVYLQTPSGYDQDRYYSAVVASLAELEDRPHGVALNLVDGLLRGLGMSLRWTEHFSEQGWAV